jgi:DNA-binding transcriptional regulator YiaG
MQDPVIKPITRKVAGHSYAVSVPFNDTEDGLTCTAETARAAELSIAAAIAEGPPSAEGFAFIRKALGFTAVRLGDLLGVRAETISRWENEASTFDRATWLALGDLALERAGRRTSSLARLERLADGSDAPNHQDLELVNTL